MTVRKFFSAKAVYWRWFAIGIAVTLFGVMIPPAYNWAGHPVRSWLSFVLFPFGMIVSDYPLNELHPRFRDALYWCRLPAYLGQFPVYGLLIAWASLRGPLRLWGWTILITHTVAVCIAGAMHYRWIQWCDLPFTTFLCRVGLSLMAGFIIGYAIGWVNQRRFTRLS